MSTEQQFQEVIRDDATGDTLTGADRGLETSIMQTIGMVTVPVVSGFAVYRWQTDDLSGAAVNTLIVTMIALSLVLGRTERFSGAALNLFGFTISSACVISSLLVSNNGLLWAMLVMLVNGLMLSRRWALGLNAIVIVVLTASPHLYQSVLQQVSWTVVATLITAFSLMSMAQLHQQRRQLALEANFDHLTGAGNRRLMSTHLQELVADRRTGQRISTLMVFDIDRFKQVNDGHGHEAGDKVLQDFVRSVQRSLRAGDGFYRMGGEEFVLLLRGMDGATAQKYLPELHQRLSGQVSTPGGKVEFSAGAATLREGEDWSRWLARADEALFHAKETGRNRLCFSD